MNINSHKSFLLQWAATAKSILTVQPSSAAVQRVFSLVKSGVTGQDYIIYGEASDFS